MNMATVFYYLGMVVRIGEPLSLHFYKSPC
jgi:hypothetical protein